MHAGAFRAQHDRAVHVPVNLVVKLAATFVERYRPDIPALEFLDSAGDVGDTSNRQPFTGSGRSLGDGTSDANGASFRYDQAVGASGIGRANDCTEIVGILDAVKDDDEGLAAATFFEQVIEIVVAFLRDNSDDALVRGRARHALEFVAAQKTDGHTGSARRVDDVLNLAVGAVLGYADVFDCPRTRLDGLADGMNAKDDVHKGKCNCVICNLVIRAAKSSNRIHKGVMAESVFILSAVRTPIGKFGGSLASLTAADMGEVAARAAMERAGVSPDQVNETIFGNARQAGGGPNVARQISMRAGVPKEVPAYTVNMACASGMKSLALAFDAIQNGNAECVLAGGTESMSRLPYYLEGARWGYRLGNAELVDGMYRDGFFCPMSEMVMGETAEVLAEQYQITREEQDAYALESQQRAQRAIEGERFADEIVPVTIEGKKGATTTFSRDEHPLAGVSQEKMAKLSPVFAKTGTITAGNASGITDGAAAMVLAGDSFVTRYKLKPMARIVAYSQAGVEPRTMGLGPVPAMQKLEQKTGVATAQYELLELNEAFAAQVLACDRELHFDREKLNVNGGAIALGHPIGCTGTRITVTLLHEMLKRKAHSAAATLCVSGGLGMALALEAVD
jgi:acetyl-CoA C-acetyltransferase